MVSRLATCACADVRISVEGEPNIVSICHCLLCQKRTGSTYSVHAYFSKNKVTIAGSCRTVCRHHEAHSGRSLP
jgi:hypothetical protein